MAIEGLRTAPDQVRATVSSDIVGSAVEALCILGLVEDRNRVTETVARDFGDLSSAGRDGEPYIQLPRTLITLEELINASDGASYAGRKYPKTSIWPDLWTPGANEYGYKADELDNLTLGGSGNFRPHARVAVHRTMREGSFYDEPLLHFRDKPFDREGSEEGQKTQLDAIGEAIAEYQSESHDSFAMTPLNAKAIAFIALVHRIKGEPMPLVNGYMNDATLPRKSPLSKSSVGMVHFDAGRMRLTDHSGSMHYLYGVGLSIGPKDVVA